MVREDILAYVRNDLGGNPNNFCQPELDLDVIVDRLASGMETAAAPVLKNLEHSNLLIGLNPHTDTTLAGWGAVSLSNYRFPWYRAFEIDMDLDIAPLTQPADSSQKQTYIKDLIQVLKQRLDANLPVILIDAGNGQYGTAFHDALTKETELGKLLSYAGFLDMAIVTGTALSHGVARYAHLTQGATSQAEEEAFCKTLADSLLKDFCYKNVVREDILAYVRNDLGLSLIHI